jgi:FAD:protein FMN transferase
MQPLLPTIQTTRPAGQTSQTAQPGARIPPTAQPEEASRSPLTTSRLRIGLGTFVAIEAEAATPAVGDRGMAAGFDAIARAGNLMHPTRAGSDVAAMSRWALGVPMRVHAWTWAVLELCQRLNRLSDGIFDPCLPGSPGRLADLELTQPRQVQEYSLIQHARLHLDLGGIAKGYAVDRAIDALRAAGCHGGLVNAGGDAAVFGARDHTMFCSTRGGSAIVTLRNAALASSEVGNESRPGEHRGYYNGADRRVTVSGSVAITAGSAAIADGLTKCVLAGDPASNAALLESFGARQIGLAVSPADN